LKWVFPIVIILCFAGCATQGISAEDVTRIVYRFGDASVPPEYHRSYTITVTKDKAEAAVDCYGDVLTRESVSISEAVFQKALDKVSESGIRAVEDPREESGGCTGGTTEVLRLYKDDKEFFSARVYHCGGKDYGTLRGDTEKPAPFLRGLFNDFDALLK
jgi:hypothetical protein